MSTVVRMNSPQQSASIMSEKKEGEVVHVEGVATEVQLERNFSFLSALGLAFSLLNSWTGDHIILGSGGPVAMVWGLVVAFVGTLAMAVSLAEICHVYPLSGGQYDWSYTCAPASLKRGLSFYTGWMASAAWTSLFAAAGSLGVSYVQGCISLWHPEYTAPRWHTFVILMAFVVVVAALNIFAVRLIPILDRAAGITSMVGIVVIIVVLLACRGAKTGDFQPANVVFAQFTNETGWPAGFAFILGLLQSTLGLTAFDAVSHLVEEMPNPAINAPKVMVLAVVMGGVTSWIFMVVLLFTLTDWDGVLNTVSGPLLTIYNQATQSRVGTQLIVMFNLFAMFVCIQCVCTVSSRMIMSFARDGGLGYASRFLSPVHPTLKVPIWSIVFVSVWVMIFGLIYLGSTVALNAILSAAIIFMQISYLIPILLVCVRGDEAFAGHSRSWTLGKWRRPINIVALLFATLTNACFVFPPAIPVTGESMNYSIVVFVVVMIMCLVTWFVDGKKHFLGPTELETRLAMGKSA